MGWNHLEQAQAVGTAFHELREREAWTVDRLEPLLAGLLELLPWLQQCTTSPTPPTAASASATTSRAFSTKRPAGWA